MAATQSQPGGEDAWSEEVRPSEQVGAKGLPLRSFIIDGLIEDDRDQLTATVKLPSAAASMRIALEATDRSDRGYILRAIIQCSAPGICERSWPAKKMRDLGLTARDLWLTATHDKMTKEGHVLIPGCLCKASSLAERLPVFFSFLPSRALNIRYSIYTESGELLDARLILDHPAGLPLTIQVAPHGAAQSQLKLVLNHIAASGGSAERFSDIFYFYQM